ncbi:DUF6993 domain-containing protein [Actinoplanes sp. NPDC004185]
MFVFGRPAEPASRPRRLIGLLLTVAVLLCAAPLAWNSFDRGSSGTTTTNSCFFINGDEREAALDLCDRRSRDEALRAVVPAEQVRRHLETTGQIYQSLRRSLCEPPSDSACYPGDARASVSGDVREVRQALEQAGYPGAVVRLAGPDDPAPADAVMFAVAREDVCLIGYVLGGRGPGVITVVGRLPNGRCLSD